LLSYNRPYRGESFDLPIDKISVMYIISCCVGSHFARVIKARLPNTTVYASPYEIPLKSVVVKPDSIDFYGKEEITTEYKKFNLYISNEWNSF